MKKEDLTGMRFGNLLVIKEAPRYISPNGESRVSWLCRCDCGKETVYRSTTLKFSGVVGCGCMVNGDHVRTHGKTRTKVHMAWVSLRNRCKNPRAEKYHLYGGRGISVCERWDSFEKFYEDMGDPPTKNHTLDRINTNGNYEPGNCRWVTQKTQTRNKRNNVLINFNGKIQCVADWSEELGINASTIYARIRKGETNPTIILKA